jgi:predicted amidophosphoribosyltransferase
MLGNVAKPVLDLLFPPLCIGCRAAVGEAGFCAACWSGITFLDGPGCACCGIPFPVALEGENICAACLANPPPSTAPAPSWPMTTTAAARYWR